MKRCQKPAAILLIASLLLLSACGADSHAQQKKTLKIGYLPITHAAPVYFEKEIAEKYLGDVELELVKFGTWIDLMDALNTGRIDGASALIELAMKSREKGIDLKAVALGHKDGNAAIVSPEVNQVEDMAGTSVAIPHTLSSHNILMARMLEKGGMSYDDVHMVEMPPPEMPSALATGQISSYVVAEPFGALGVTMDQGKVLYQSEELWPGSLCCALVLRNGLIQNHPEISQKFMNGYVAAGKEAGKDDEHTHSIHKKYLDVNDEALKLSLGWISYDDLKVTKEDYEVLRDSLIEMGLSDGPPSYENFVNNSLIDEAINTYEK
ncbi:ABC transporter substrate-binding protein [Lentibacillus amyloliquefaciens]|uniref:Metal ABC transporter substrate-binding protein n=1 Tax=Lentibacillus amyloliquefaciens TaxID=1472767 RepID=A0A0U4FJU3_9BACI|nr:ABC transporter substrate-binding protein [Lentibacillus amyloliquefaciens]ALX48926.1 metal ABC transporter substrate-binding protein [Lentibacillus amyloliquefaciens]